MREGYLSVEELKQHLADTGLSEENVSDVISGMLCGRQRECVCRLEAWRTELLNEIHRHRHSIESIDEMLRDLREASPDKPGSVK